MAESADFFVDYAALEAVAAKLDVIIGSFESLGASPDAPTTVTGNARVTAAYAAFSSAWAMNHDAIAREISAARTVLAHAEAVYRAADEAAATHGTK